MEKKQKRREFIKDYSKIIPFLKKVFYYGTFSSADYDEMKMMKKSEYSYNKRKLEYAFGNLLVERKNMKGKKALGLRIDHFYDPHLNFLRFFSLKSYVSNARLIQICFVLQLLSSGRSYKIKEIVDQASEYSDASYINEVGFRRLLEDMSEKGITEKSNKTYRIAAIGLEGDSTIDKLVTLIDLCTNIYPLSICGYHVCSKLKIDYESPFLFKHRHLGQIFDDEVIWKLAACIYERNVVVIEYDGTNFCSLLPYKIITDEVSGRQYVFVVNVNDKDVFDHLLRIDRIINVKLDTGAYELPDDVELEERFSKALKHSFTGKTVPYGKEPDTGTLVFLSAAEKEVKKRFPDAVIEKVDDNYSKCYIKVNNMIELKPWLRVNMGRIKLTESSDNTVEEMKRELEEWRKMYGVV